MKKLLILSIAVIAFSSGCSVINIFETQADYERKYLAMDQKIGIDQEIQSELKKEKPTGQVEPYSQELWISIWRTRIKRLKTIGFSELKNYRGPRADWFADYIISERRKFGLPELGP
jgi:hypothetical protein